VVHFDAGAPDRTAEQIALLSQDSQVDAVLVDSRTATAVGGTGVTFDWNTARRTIFGEGARLKLVAAGGLNPENVAEAVGLLQPWGVDVVSGVEAAPGRKEPKKVGAFVARARAMERV
jgi:phosphoribosylanthranilate isomerase